MKFLFLLYTLCVTILCKAQERVGPLKYHPPIPLTIKGNTSAKTTALSLPFFEDFTDDSRYVNPARWIPTAQVYVNNNMGVNMRSRGVATFDAINSSGVPYDTLNPAGVRLGDTLISQPIDLSSYQSTDSLYLSFLLQPQGYGFAPETQDSFLVYFKNASQQWIKVRQIAGSPLKDFFPVILGVTNPAFFHADFQFRMINKISINSNDDVWNLDYVQMDVNRSFNDTLIQDIAFTSTPSSLLKDLTAMPYRHYLSNAVNDRAPQVYTYVYNNNNNTVNINSSWDVTAYPGAQLIHSNNIGSQTLSAKSIMTVSDNSYFSTISSPGWYDRVVFDQRFWFQTSDANSSTVNDTIVHHQIFDNYLAYDDGTAEKSYYLNLFSTLPGKIAVEFSIPNPDTLKGLAIYFGRQSPMATNKLFGIQVYQSIGYMGAQEVKLYEEFNFTPRYDSVNHFWYYRLNQDVPLPAGTFFVGTMQPAFSGADSLYIGLDVHRNGGNHAYYNVLNNWESSLVSGALMIRPLLGKAEFPAQISIRPSETIKATIHPNPASEWVQINPAQKGDKISIWNAQGNLVMSDSYSLKGISISVLPPATYFIQWDNSGNRYNGTFIKN